MPARDSACLLTIGNSFTRNATEFLPKMVAAAGRNLAIFRADVSGKSLAFHARHMAFAQSDPDDERGKPYKNKSHTLRIDDRRVSLPQVLVARNWEFVTLQQASPLSHKPETYEPHAGRIIAAIRSLAPRAEILVHQTWAYREDCPLYEGGFTQQSMFDGLRAAYAAMAERYGGLRIIPSGAAMQAARNTPRWTYRQDPQYDFENPPHGELPRQCGSLNVGWRWVGSKTDPSDKRLALDFKHANRAGKYLMACVWFEVVYETECEATAAFTPPGMTLEDTADLRRIAHRVVHGFDSLETEGEANS